MYSDQQIYNKLSAIYKSPIDASKVVESYSNDLLQHALSEYEKWKANSQQPHHSINYFKKILETGFNGHQTKEKEKEIKKNDAAEQFQKQIKRSENMHEILFENKRVKDFLTSVIQKLSDPEKEIIKSRARNHLCYSKTSEKYDEEIREMVKSGEIFENVIEKFYNRFEILLKKSMLTEMRSQLLAGNFWKLAEVKNINELKFLREV